MLTPLDIHQKEFSISFRGYHTDEVNDFLDQVIKDFEVLHGGDGVLKLSPLEISNREFSKVMRGYNMDEVNEFLDQVIGDYEACLLQGAKAMQETAAGMGSAPLPPPASPVAARITPEEIHIHEFSQVPRGYDIDEVNDLLDRIIHDYSLTLEENRKLAERLRLYEERFGSMIP